MARVSLPSSDTVYLTVVDKNRLSVSFINSIYWDFGSGIVTPKSGITLQNRGKGFVTQARPSQLHRPRPSARLHTIIPAMAKKDGKIDMSFGVMGGDFQPMGHVNVVVNRYVYGMDPQAALDFPRLFPQGRDRVDGKHRSRRRPGRPRRQRPPHYAGERTPGRRPGHRHRSRPEAS